MKTRLTEVRWLEAHPDITLPELAELSGLPAAELLALTEFGVFRSVDAAAEEPSYSAGCGVTARAAFRLRRDLELDTDGLALVLKLLEQMRDLEAELHALKARLPGGL
jgi:chaperone modulatory protein CbpM